MLDQPGTSIGGVVAVLQDVAKRVSTDKVRLDAETPGESAVHAGGADDIE